MIQGTREFQAFVAALFSACILYRGQEAKKEMIDAYWRRMKHYPLRAVLDALDKACQESPQWFPTAFQIEAHVKAFAKSYAPYTPSSRLLESGKQKFRDCNLHPDLHNAHHDAVHLAADAYDRGSMTPADIKTLCRIVRNETGIDFAHMINEAKKES